MDNELGKRIRQARLDKKMTQLQLAKTVGLSSHVTICDLERGKTGRRPNTQLMVKICKTLGVSIDWMFLGKEDKNRG